MLMLTGLYTALFEVPKSTILTVSKGRHETEH